MAGYSFWFTNRAVAVPELLIVRAFEMDVLVAVMLKTFVTVKLDATRFWKLAVPATVRFPESVESRRTVRSLVLDKEYTFRSPVTLEYPI
jgi:hypothetical protein